MGYYHDKDGNVMSFQDVKDKVATENAKGLYQSTLTTKQEAAGQKLHASGMTQAAWDEKNKPKYQVSTPGVLDQKYTVTSSGGLVDEKGNQINDADRDRIGRTAGVVEYQKLDQNGNVIGSFLAPDTGFTANEGIRKVGEHEAATVSTDPNQELGHKLIPPPAAETQQAESEMSNKEKWWAGSSAYPSAQSGQYSTDLDTSGTFNSAMVEDPKERNSQAVKQLDNISSTDLLNQISGMDFENMSAGDILKNQFLMTMQAATVDDQNMNAYFDNLITNAQEGYAQGQEYFKTAILETGKAVEGEEFIPTTVEGLNAKIAEQSKSLGLESIEAEKDYVTEQHQIWQKEEGAKRAKLEGFLKAKLYAMGAQDSTAGLEVLATTAHQADLRIQQEESQYSYGLAQLNISAREIMMNFTNNVTGIALDIKGQQDTAASTMSEKIDEIENNRFLNERESQKLKLQTMSEFSDKMVDLKEKQRAQALEEQKFAFDQMKNAQDNAYKLSGLSGTIYVADENGELVNTGTETWDAKQFKANYALEKMQYDRLVANDSFSQAMDLLGAYGSGAAGSVEMMLGMPSGTLSNLETIEEQNLAIKKYEAGMVYSASLYEANYTNNGASGGPSPLGTMYKDGYYEQSLECGFFVRTKFFDLPPMGDTLQQKIGSMDNTLHGQAFGSSPDTMPQVGQMLIMDVNTTYGHVALINEVRADGSVVLTESNYRKKWTVDNTRVLTPDQFAQVKAVHTGDLKPEIAQQLGVWQQGKNSGVQTSTMDIYIKKAIDTGLDLKSATEFAKKQVLAGLESISGDSKKANEIAKDIMNPLSGFTLKDVKVEDRASIASELNKMKDAAFKSGDVRGQIAASGGGKELDATATQSLVKAQNVLGQLDELESTIMNMDTDPISGAWRSNDPYDVDYKVLKAQLQSIVPNLARGIYGEVGVLTDNDIQNYIQTLPNGFSTEDQKEALLAFTKRVVNNSIKNNLSTYAMAGYDVSGFTPLVDVLEPPKVNNYSMPEDKTTTNKHINNI